MAGRLGRLALAALLLLVVLTVGAVAWLAWFPDTLRPALARALGAQLGLPVRLGGTLAVDLGRVTTVELRGLRVAAPDWAREDDLARLDRLRVGLDLWAYLRSGRIAITELVLDAPGIHLERDQQGRTSWPQGEGGGGLPPVTLERLEVTEGRLDLVDATVPLEVAAEFATTGATAEPTLRVDADGTALGEPLGLAAQVTGDGASLAVEELAARWGATEVAGRLALDLEPEQPLLEGSLRADTLDLAALPSPDGAEDDPRPAGTGTPENPLGALAGYRASVELAAGRVLLPGGGALGATSAKLELADDRLSVPLRIDLPPGALEGELSASVAESEPEVAVRLTAAGAGLGGPAGEGYAGTIDGTLEGTLVVGARREMLERSRLRLTVSGADLAIPQAQLGTVEVAAILEDGRIQMDPLEARLPQGTVSGRAAVAPFDDAATTDVELDLAGVDLGAIARVEGFGGRLDGRVTGVVRGTAPLDILTRSSVELTGAVEGLRLPQLEERIARADIDASLDPERREALRIAATAEAGDRSLSLTAFGGSAATLAQNRGDYPFTVTSELGRNEVEINGTVSLPLTERRLTATIAAEGPDPSPILALLGLPKLQIPPYRLEGAVASQGDELRVRDFAGQVGDSDLAADLVIGFAGPRPLIAGTITSSTLDADDLGGLVGAAPASGPGETASAGQAAEAEQNEREAEVIPDEPIEPERWRRVDLDLDLRVETVRAGKLPLEGLAAQVTLRDGVLRIDEMDLAVGGGRLTGSIEADGSGSPVTAEVELDLRRVSMARLLNRLDVDVDAFGTLSGRAQGGVGLGGAGRSIKEILARSDGRVQLLVDGGRIDRTIVAGLGLDLLRLLGAATGASPDTVEMRCALAELEVRDGVVATDPLLIVTEIAELGGRGTIDLATEAIDLSLTARPKDTPLLTDLTGISVGGRLGDPQIEINPVAVAARGVAAATLGLVLKPFTALADSARGETASACDEVLAAER